MTAPERITVAMDDETFMMFKKLQEVLGISQSELVRQAVKFYSKYRVLIESMEDKKMYTHAEMLKVGEHVIVDIDHWLLFLRFMETHPDKEQFWELNKPIYEAHAEFFKHKSYGVEDVLKRLEACNYYTLNQVSRNDYTLILSSDVLKKFVKTLLEETFRGMGFTVELKEDFAKLRVKVLSEAPKEKGRS
ncbi:MAG TPA: CopG family transcriptional regulator [Methanomicrobia archaeon]|nr:CopG family transcriptional regulator [Methanomicrobia archaeon]